MTLASRNVLPHWCRGHDCLRSPNSSVPLPWLHEVVGRPLLRRGEQRDRRRAVERLADDVGVPGMPCGLFDQVQEHPANGPGLNILRKPRHTSRDGDRVAEIVEVSNEFLRLVRRHGIVGEDLVETVVGREPETVYVLRRVRPRRAPHGVHPAALYLRQMLDDATY